MSKTVYLDTKIIEGCRQQKAKYQMQLYDTYCEAMYIIANRYVKDSFMAEDIMQDAFIKVFKNIESFRGEVTIGAWIKKIVINQCIDYLKKKKIELVSIDEYAIDVTEENNWKVETEVTFEMVNKVLNELPEKYKVVLNLYLLEGYNHKEIAQILTISEVASRSQLMRGKTMLKEQLKKYQYV